MKRQDKYPETRWFHYYNANPHNKLVSDCVFRAISVALGQSWETTVLDMTELGLKYGYPANDNHTIDKYLSIRGWVKCKQPRKEDNTKYTGKEWCTELQEPFGNRLYFEDKIIANIGGHHIVAIVDGKVWDTWDSTDGCIGNYWKFSLLGKGE